MSRPGRGRSFVYSTSKPSADPSLQQRKRKRSPESAVTYAEEAAGGSTATGSHTGSYGLAPKIQRTETDFEDDEFDDFGAAALEQFELTQTTTTLNRRTESSASTASTTKWNDPYQKDSRQPTTISPVRSTDPNSLHQVMERLQEENFTKDGEVKVLRSEKERLLGELREREEQMRTMQLQFTSEKKAVETQLSKENGSLTAKLQFKEQELSALQGKCLLLEQHSKSLGMSKPAPTPRPTKTGGSSSRASSNFLLTENFMPSQANDSEITSAPTKPRRSTRERSVSISDKKPDAKPKKARISRSPTTTPSDTLSGRRTSKSSKSGSPSSKSLSPAGVCPLTILSVQSKELDDTQLLMLLIRRDLLKPPVFMTTDEQAVPPPPVVTSEKDSQSSDEDSSSSSPESSQTSLTGLLSLLRVQPKSKSFSGSFATPVRHPDVSLKASSSSSALDSSPTVSTPIQHKRLRLSKMRTLARTDSTKPRHEQEKSSLVSSYSASNTPLHSLDDKRTSSLLYSVDKSGLEKSIGKMLQSADHSSISRVDTTLSATSFCPNNLHSRMSGNSSIELLKRMATIVLQYHDDQSLKAKGTVNTSVSDFGDSAESNISIAKSISSSGSSKASSELFSPLRCDQDIVSKSLEILETLICYSPRVRDQVLLQPPKFTLDSQPGSFYGTHGHSSISSSLDVRCEREDRRKTLLSCDLEEVSRRLSFMREGSSAPVSPVMAAKDHRPFVEGKVWKEQRLANIRHPHCTLSSNAWTRKENSPQRIQELSFCLPEFSHRVGDVGGLFNALLEMPAPPWKESPKNILICLKILTALAEDCSVDTLQQFAPLLEGDVIGVCLDKEDPNIVLSTLSLLSHLVRSPPLVGLLCHNSPCVPVSCYDICLPTLPDPEHRHSGYAIHLQVVRVISEVLITENGASVLFSSSCQCHQELLKTLVLLLSCLIDSTHETSQWTQQELTLVLEVVSLMHKISVHDNYFDTHLMECEHTYTSVLNSLSWLLPTHHTPLREVAMVTDLLDYAEEMEDSEELDRMDTKDYNQ